MTNQAVKKPSRAARVEAAAQEIADKVAALLEQGVMPWRRPWKAGAHGLPFNGATGRRYSGTNILSLWLAEQLGGYDDARWYTFKQAQACGGRVRSGEKSSPVFFYNQRTFEEENDRGETETKCVPVARVFRVFNHHQILWEQGRGEEVYEAPVELRNVDAAALMSLARVTHGGFRAYYQPSTDRIQMPRKDAFAHEADYWATGLHELTHWTGHAGRLDRLNGYQADPKARALEELIAELGSATLCAMCGVSGDLGNHASYVDSWLERIREEPKALMRAAAAAQRAVTFLEETQQQA